MGGETFVLISNVPRKEGPKLLAPIASNKKQMKIQQKPKSYDEGPTPQIGS
jgi:hypothetical protein